MTRRSVPRELYVAGTRTFAAEVAGFAEDCGCRVLGLLEPYDRTRVGTTIHGHPVSWLEETPAGTAGAAIVGTGESARRPIVTRLRAVGWNVTTLVHPRAHVARSSSIGTGVLLGPGVIVGACTRIGDHVVLGRGSLVGHHVEIGAFTTLGPGANVAGNVRIGEDVYVAMGAVLRDHISVGSGARIGMGAVVTREIAPGAEVRGLPARVHGAVQIDPQVAGQQREDADQEAGRRSEGPPRDEPDGFPRLPQA